MVTFMSYVFFILFFGPIILYAFFMLLCGAILLIGKLWDSGIHIFLFMMFTIYWGFEIAKTNEIQGYFIAFLGLMFPFAAHLERLESRR